MLNCDITGKDRGVTALRLLGFLKRKEQFLPAQERLALVFGVVFSGLHHVRNIKKYDVGTKFEYWEVNTFEDLSTFDHDRLTKLVLAAHKYCIRASIMPSGPNMVKIRLHPRYSRTGSISQRHPTMEQVFKEK